MFTRLSYPLKGILIALSAYRDNHYQAHQQMSFVIAATNRSGHAHALEVLAHHRR